MATRQTDELLAKVKALPPKQLTTFLSQLHKWLDEEYEEVLLEIRAKVAKKGWTEEDIQRMCDEVRHPNRRSA